MSHEVNNALKEIGRQAGKETNTQKAIQIMLKGMQKVGNAYGIVDDIAKIARMRYAIEQEGKTMLEAGQIAQDTHYDYGLTYDIIRQLRNPDITKGAAVKLIANLFPTYMHKTIAYTWETFKHRPASLSVMYAGVYALVYTVFGNTDDENEEIVGKKKFDRVMASIPRWIKENPMVAIKMEMIDGEVYVTFTDISHNVPQGTLAVTALALAKGDFGTAITSLGFGTSPVQAVGQLYSNREGFMQKDIYYEYDEVQKAKDILAFVGKLASPGIIDKWISLNATRHAVAPRFAGLNTYTYTLKPIRKDTEVCLY